MARAGLAVPFLSLSLFPKKRNTRQTPFTAWFAHSFRFVLGFGLGCARVWTSEAQSDRTKHKETHQMSTYESFLAASVAYIRKHGKTRKTLDNLESLLPACWAAELIADALDSI